MKFNRVVLEALGYVIPPLVVKTTELEAALAPCLRRLKVLPGQLAALTGITERRYWPVAARLSDPCIEAARKALLGADLSPHHLGAVIYCGVSREQFEPATACRIAAELGVSSHCELFDLSNACLGVLNGIVEVANRIELGQIKAGLVVSAESAREINEETIQRLNERGTADDFRLSLATLTGGSAAVAVVLSDGSFQKDRPRLLGGVTRVAPQHFNLCRWGVERIGGRVYQQFMTTDAAGILRFGVELGKQTWHWFLQHLGWLAGEVDRVICHQVGSVHREAILETLGIQPHRDFSTFPLLGNTGTVALPLTAAIAEEQGVLQPGQRVGFLGIGSGLTCQMLGWRW